MKALDRIKKTYPEEIVAWASPILQHEVVVTDVIGWYSKTESSEEVAEGIKKFLFDNSHATTPFALYCLKHSPQLDGDSDSLAVVLCRFALYQIFYAKAIVSQSQS